MFNEIIPEILQPDSVYFDDPKYLTLHFENEQDRLVSLEKGANNFIYKMYRLKEGTSKEVFKKSLDIWKRLISHCEEENFDKSHGDNFSLCNENNLFLVTDSNSLIDIYWAFNDEDMKNFKDKYKEFKLDITEMTNTKKFFTEGKNGLIKIVFYSADYDIVHEPYTPVVLLEANSTKSVFNVYTGVLIYSSFTLIPNLSPYSTYSQFTDLVKTFSIKDVLAYATENGKSLYEDYKKFKESSIEISARELVSLLNKTGYKLQLKDDNDLDEIKDINEVESSERIQKFFNTFKFTTGETAVDILRLSDFQKIFRYNKLTLTDVLEILSREYIKYEGSKITAEDLSSIVYILYDRTDDKKQVEQIKKEMD